MEKNNQPDKNMIPSDNPIRKEKPDNVIRIVEGEETNKPFMGPCKTKQVQIESSDESASSKPKKKRKLWLWFIIIPILGVLAYFGYNAYAVAKRIITDNNSGGSPFLKFLDKVEPKKLQGEGDGRVNILLMGIGGPGHDGADLTDTVIVVSIDPINKTVSMLSIPRDLWVKMPGNGETKINAVHSYGEMNKKKFIDGPTIAKETISQILDLPIHYYIRLDFEGFKKLVDEMGGVDVTVEKDIVDPYYPDDRTGRNITYRVKAGPQHMDGAAALKYARSRYTTSDFDRAKRQQILLKGIKDKAFTLGVMANPAKLTSILNIIGDHVRTDMQIWEMQRLLELMKDVNTTEIAHRVLDNSADGLLKDGNVNGAYVLLPRSGNYSEIQALAHSIFTEPYLLKEKARIEIQYPKKQATNSKTLETRLKEFGYNVVAVVPANPGEYSDTTILDLTKGQKPYTVQLLSNRIKNVKLLSDNSTGRTDVDIVIVLGDNYQPN